MTKDIQVRKSAGKVNALGKTQRLILRELMTTWKKIASFILRWRARHNSVLFDVYASVNLMMKETHWKALKRKSKGKVISAYLNENIRRSKAIRDRKCDVVR